MNIISLSRNKKILLVALFVIVVVLLFSLKTKTEFKNQTGKNGLVYSGSETVEELVNRDTDLDGVPDWEESLWGTDPTKPDTNGDGIPDGVEIKRLKGITGTGDSSTQTTKENLTETDKFSRELFSTIATLNQIGNIDQDAIDNISNSLAQQIQSSAKQIFLFSDLKTIQDSSAEAIKKYDNSLESLIKKYPTLSKNSSTIVYPIQNIFVEVFQEFLSNSDADVLNRFDPVIKEIKGLVAGMVKTPVPQGLAVLHLDVINGLERVAENLNDLKSIEGDTIVAMGAASKFKENIELLQASINKLQTAINQQIKGLN